jgi:hypothetical protein
MTGGRRVASVAVLRRRVLLSLIVSLTMGVQVVHGAPSRATRLARALHCCAHRCPDHHPVSQTGARHCCNVQPADADSGARVATPELDAAPSSTAALSIAVPVVHAPAFGGWQARPRPVARAAPLFLLSRTLRL